MYRLIIGRSLLREAILKSSMKVRIWLQYAKLRKKSHICKLSAIKECLGFVIAFFHSGFCICSISVPANRRSPTALNPKFS